MARLEKSEQRTDGAVYPSEYKYNLAGALIEQTYPSGRVVKNVLGADGDISMIQSKRNENFGFHNYAKHFSYNAAGAVTSMQLGNGLWETAQFNSRLQSTQLRLGALPTGADLWKVDYEFGELQTNGTVDAVKNSGNIARQTLTVPGTSFVQSYTYDSLYRLTEAVEKTGTTTNWSQQFGYDRYGNRTSLAQDIGGIAKNTTPAVDANTNRFTSTDFAYDANGNIVEDIDEMTSLPREFIFNGDNKQTEVKRDGVTIGRYYYDGEGRRIKKVSDTETTVFVYAAGQLIAEYSTAISQSPSVSYTTSDHLGSPRVITNELGQVSSRRDFMPFGEELYAGVGNRTGDTGLKYSSADDDIRQKFTGYQKDDETNLDFAEARMYANNFGRFTAVDPLLASGKSSDPQSFNRFLYVMNNPLMFVDPEGLCSIPSGLKAGQVGICIEAFIAARRIDTFGHGDARKHESNDPSATARMRFSAIVSLTDSGYSQNVQEALIAPSDASIPIPLGPTAPDIGVGPPALPAEGSITSNVFSVGPYSIAGSFGDGLESSTQMRVELRDGANGYQVAARDMQVAGALAGNPIVGAALVTAGQTMESNVPPGTIDVSVQIRITGSGNNINVGASAQSRPFPSVSGWAYTVNADGTVKITPLFRRDETKPSELTKPMTPIN